MSELTKTSLYMISGRYFDTASPNISDLRAIDFTWGMANINRFGGHSLSPWSVLDHTALVFSLAMQDRKGALSIQEKLALLLHDATEGLLGSDIPRPLKSILLDYQNVEAKLATLLEQRFNIFGVDPGLIDRYDNQALWIETLTLIAPIDVPYVQAVYPMDKVPALKQANVRDYLGLLQGLAAANWVPDVEELFEVPEYLQGRSMQTPYVTPAQAYAPGAIIAPGQVDYNAPPTPPVKDPGDTSLTLAEVRALSKQGSDRGSHPDLPIDAPPRIIADLYSAKV